MDWATNLACVSEYLKRCSKVNSETLDSLLIDMGLFVLAGLIIYFSSPGKFFNLRPWFIIKEGEVNSSPDEER